MTDTPPLHQMQPLARFSDRAKDYARYRPSYPAAAITFILQGLGEPSQLTAADVGAGTGISSRLLAERGVRVWAIEPNAEMRQAAEPHPSVTFQAGSAEHTELADASVDLVTCFQAFHWFEPVASLREFHRILRPCGRLALVWNDRDRQDEFTASYSRLVQAASAQHPAERDRAPQTTAETLTLHSRFHQVQHQAFAYRQSLDLTALIGRATSTSYLPRVGPEFEQLMTDLKRLHHQWADTNGEVHLAYCTNVFLAEAS